VLFPLVTNKSKGYGLPLRIEDNVALIIAYFKEH
jgi:hypothetical protein